ncbi:MAG: hypothetical protein ACHQRK_03575 [Gemmatimonadales bacterium]
MKPPEPAPLPPVLTPSAFSKLRAPRTSRAFSVESQTRLRSAFERHEERRQAERVLTEALDAMCQEAHFRRMTPRMIVDAMHDTWLQVTRPESVRKEDWDRDYYAALGICITTFFEPRA